MNRRTALKTLMGVLAAPLLPKMAKGASCRSIYAIHSPCDTTEFKHQLSESITKAQAEEIIAGLKRINELDVRFCA